MPFKKGPAPWRRTLEYLNSGSLVFRERVKVCSVHYHETDPASEGLRNFVFWHLGQIQYKNPQVQCVQLKNLVASPFITIHSFSATTSSVDSVHVNCYKMQHAEILARCKRMFGKTDEEIAMEKRVNRANFGENCSRHCICLMEGQVACPRFKPLPWHMRGKYRHYKHEELDELRKTKSDEQAMREYWTSK